MFVPRLSKATKQLPFSVCLYSRRFCEGSANREPPSFTPIYLTFHLPATPLRTSSIKLEGRPFRIFYTSGVSTFISVTPLQLPGDAEMQFRKGFVWHWKFRAPSLLPTNIVDAQCPRH